MRVSKTVLSAFSLFLLLSSLYVSPPSFACEGEPVAPTCGRSAVFVVSTPANVLAIGGVVTIESLFHLSVAEFPLGSGLCPPGPFLVDIDFTVTCTPSGDATGSVMDIPVTRGYNQIDVDVVLPPGPPRICAVDGTATVEFVDGTTVTATGGTQICLGEEAPTLPDVPRLELEMLDPGLSLIHPGDQGSHRVRLTNNDPTETWNGALDADMVNRSLLPLIAGPVPLGHGAFGIADPAGDHFPLAFADELAACLPLPPDPHVTPVSALNRDLDLLPGTSIELEIVSRPWGMCADGSCGQGRVVIDGLFTDASAGFACSGFATAADISAPPSFSWPDTGATALMGPPLDPLLPELPFSGFGAPTMDPFALLFQLPQADLVLDGLPPIPAQPTASELDPERGRIGLGFDGPDLFPVGAPFGVGFRLELPPDPGGDVVMTEVLDLQLIPGAPTGLSDIGPVMTGLLRATRGAGQDQEILLFDLVMRLSGLAIDDLNQPLPLQFQDVQIVPPQPLASGVDLFVQAVVLSPNDAPALALEAGGGMVQELDVFVDFRAHAKLGEAVFNDDFESGDLSAWSSSVP